MKRLKKTQPETLVPVSNESETFGLLLLSVRQSLIRRSEKLLISRGFDLNLTQFRVLRALSLAPSLNATELARTVEHDGGALTRILDRLENKGVVLRQQSANDRRAVDVSLTEDGKKLWDSMKDCVTQLNEEVLEILSEQEQRQLFDLLHRIRDRIGAKANKT